MRANKICNFRPVLSPSIAFFIHSILLPLTPLTVALAPPRAISRANNRTGDAIESMTAGIGPAALAHLSCILREMPN